MEVKTGTPCAQTVNVVSAAWGSGALVRSYSITTDEAAWYRPEDMELVTVPESARDYAGLIALRPKRDAAPVITGQVGR